MLFSKNIEDALVLAAQAHQAQQRKVNGEPYITHPIHVAFILLKCGYDENIIIASILHDVVEDSHIELTQIERRFGNEVKEIVYNLSEEKYDQHGPIEWEIRKSKLLQLLIKSDNRVAVVRSADLLHNASTLLFDLNKYGSTIWKNFNSSSTKIVGHYRSMFEIVREKDIPQSIVSELESVINQLEIAITK